MSTNKQKDTTHAQQPHRPAFGAGKVRRTIGYMARFLSDKNNYSVYDGVLDVAREKDVNVISLFPEDLDTTNGFDAQANILYDLIDPTLLDGLVIWTSTLMTYADPRSAKYIFEHYRSIPIICIERGGPDDIPYLEIDSYQSTREAVTHLIRDHGHRRIAFICGPAAHVGACDRYQGYLDVLSEYGIPFDPDLVSPPTEGSWRQEVGEEAIALLLDQRHASFDALLGACDNIAIGAMRALDARGIHIPDKVAVIGFDDETGSRSIIPPLTTMSLRGYEQGRQATEMLLTLLDGGQIPTQVKVPPQLVVRQSCGCIDPAVAQAAAGQVSVDAAGLESLERFTTDQREKVLSEMKQAAGTAAEKLDPGWAGQLLDAFLAELKAGKSGTFLSVLGTFLRQIIRVEGQVEAWSNVIFALRRCMLPYLGNNQMRAEDLWLQGQVMIGGTAQQVQRHQAAQLEQQTQILNEIRTALITTLDINGVMDILVQTLPRLGISGCYLSLYENPKQPTVLSRLMLAYDIQRGRLDLETKKQVFPSPRLAPDGILPQDRRYNLVTQALYFREEQLGFVLFDAGLREGLIYVMLREEISSALQRALILDERKREKDALEKEQYLLNALMENVPDYIYFKDLESRFIRTTKAHAKAFGLSDPAQVIGKSDFDFFTEEHSIPAYNDEQEIIRTGQAISMEERETWPNRPDTFVLATKMPLRDRDGKIIGTFGISKDITERKRAEVEREQLLAELTRQQYILDTFMDNIPDLIYFKDIQSRLTRTNRAFATRRGIKDPSELVGKSDFDLFPLDQAEIKYQQEQEIIKTGQPILNLEEPDGVDRWVLTTKMPLRDEKGIIVGTFGISSNITELVRAKQAAEAAREEADKARSIAEMEKETAQAAKNQLEKAHHQVNSMTIQLQQTLEGLEQRVAERTRELEQARDLAEAATKAKSLFLANMSHELRTPLSVMISHSEMLQEDAQELGYEQLIPSLQRIRASGNHLLNIITNLLDMSKIEAGKMEYYLETFDVTSLVNDVGAILQPIIEKKGNMLEIYCAPDLGSMHADLTKVRQTLFNLLDNAAKFTDHGTIRLSVTRESDSSISSGQVEWINFRITDTGIGLTPEQIQNLFKEFTQADNSITRLYGGTGLGLTLSRHYCRMMGGEITVSSAGLGEGSTFIIRLPVTVVHDTAQASFEEGGSSS